MFLSGFTDEAGAAIDTQIKATLELGWSHIELRNTDAGNLAAMPEESFEYLAEKLKQNSIQLSCFGSAIANWQCLPRDEESFQKNITELTNAIPRMQKLGVKLVRGMSYAIPKDEQFDSPELEKIIYKKVNHLVNICEENGLIYGHENCMNYAGQSYEHTMRLIEAVKSDSFTLIYDTGNPVFTFLRLGEKPYKLQNSFEFYKNIKEFISYVHIKDAVSTITIPDEEVKTTFTFAGEGDGCIKEILTDLIQSGYDGCFSIEPHVATVFHNKDEEANSEIAELRKYETYIEYGKKFEQLLNSIITK